MSTRRAAARKPTHRPILVGENETVRYAADALALIAARTEDEAARARDLIKVTYEELPSVHSVEEAVAAGDSPFIEDHLERGDVEAALSGSHLVVEEQFFIPWGEHLYLEPEAGYAYIDEHDGVITVCVGTQDAHQQLQRACDALGLPYNRVRIRRPLHRRLLWRQTRHVSARSPNPHG